MLNLVLKKDDLEGRKVFFTSDLHLNHFNICRLCKRPFSTRAEMNNILITNWNSVVNDNDIIFILGDFCFDQKSQWIKFLKQLSGKKYLIQGNHDKPNSIPHDMFEAVADIVQLYLYSHDVLNEDGGEIQEKYDKFVLCHYPMLSYLGMFSGFYQLYGHVHTRENNTGADAHLLKYLINSYDVGVDNNNFTPVSRENVIKILKQNF